MGDPNARTSATPESEGLARMVDRAKADGAIRSAAVEAAFRATPRHLFLPGVPIERVYGGDVIVTKLDDRGQPISSSSQVAIMAPMLEDLEVHSGHRVLEIGAGTGYNAALLDHLVGVDGRVVSVELDAALAATANEHLAAAGHERVRVVVGDGYLGHAEGAPYDRIIATASVSDLPRAWLEQLVDDGRLTVPLRLGASQVVVTFARRGDAFESVKLVPGGFMALRGEQVSEMPGIALDGEWEVSSPSVVDSDASTLVALLRERPAIEQLPREVRWHVSGLLGLLAQDWVTVRQRLRPFAWSGIYDRASGSLALISFTGIPMRSGTWLTLAYGRSTARERLLRLIEDAEHIDLRDLRIEAVPVDRAAHEGDVVAVGQDFRYTIRRPPEFV